MAIERQRWELGYYCQVLSYLDFLYNHEDIVQGIGAGFTKNNIGCMMCEIQDWSYVYYKEADDDEPVIYITIKDYYNDSLAYLLYYYRVVGVPGYDIIGDASIKWGDSLREQAREYADRKKKEREEMEAAVLERRRLHREKLAERAVADTAVKDEILSYLADCDKNGTKPVLKSLAREGFTAERIYRLRKELRDSGKL